MSLSWPDHQLTLEEWDALPEDLTLRVELVEGILQVSPRPTSWHQRAGMRIGYRLDEQLPRDLTALTGVEIVVSDAPPTVRVPDVIVARTTTYDGNSARYAASDLLLAGEVLSDGTRRVDRVMKFAEYAEAGIPQYWIVDLTAPVTLLAYILVDEHYELSGEYTGVAELSIAGHPVTIDLDALTPR